MKKYLFVFLILASIANGDIIKREKFESGVMQKIEFDGHTYIHYKNRYTYADHGFLHDPGCVCKQITDQKIREVVEIIKQEKK